ncbi:serpin family protein [Kitasatospora cathayae]|uniref:Proteinase inhibitor I4 serpin n=1 Tax=Kitasatospora cathayae TaxID=3004092 RepID=A0ABY7QDB9_9ACTN|nr:serpin family protein [Kitasatospora sp. HUAS 3-15]WBP90722.1 proteinase inhibitor I4 serpin [Kitasatospora sp. HUAS 3-15]
MSRAQAVRAANALGERWVGQTDPGRGTVLMPAGVWPLLGLLAPAGSTTVQGELAQALGVPVAVAAERARALLGLLRDIPAVRSALGVWSDDRLRLSSEWLASVPADLVGRLTGDAGRDRALLYAWAAEQTDGQIEEMPVEPGPDNLLVLAAALTVRTDWIKPFRDYGAFGEDAADGWGRGVHYLTRATSLLDRAALLETSAGPLTELRVLGCGDISVHLLLGEPEAAPGDVLSAGIGVLSQRVRRTTADRLPVGVAGPGLTIEAVRRYEPEDRLFVSVPKFTVEAGHDLIAHRGLFGLETLASRSETEDRLPGLSDGEPPLFVNSARQKATASFSARGFRAASVTAMGMMGGSAGSTRKPPYLQRFVEVGFTRPFGFLAVHRLSGLVLAAGWVTEPDPGDDPWGAVPDESEEWEEWEESEED